MKKKIKALLCTVAAMGATLSMALFAGCSLKEKLNQLKCEHEYGALVVIQESTCLEKGKGEKTCFKCDKVEEVKLELADHMLIVTEAVESTCTKTGLASGTKCADCGEVITAQQEFPALGHRVVKDKAVDPTCLEFGLTEGTHCSRCNEVLEAQEKVPATGHALIVLEAVEATCTTAGKTQGVVCERCQTMFVEQEIIPAMGHNLVVITGKPATCMNTGLTEGQICQTCDTVCVEQKLIPFLDHVDTNGDLLCDTCGELLDISEEAVSMASFAEVSSGTLMAGWYRVPASSSNGLLVFSYAVGDAIFEHGDTVSAISGLTFDYFVSEEGIIIGTYPYFVDGTYSNSNYSVMDGILRGDAFALEQVVYDGYVYFYIPNEMSCEVTVSLYDITNGVRVGTIEGECVISSIRLDHGTGVQKVLFSVSNEY